MVMMSEEGRVRLMAVGVNEPKKRQQKLRKQPRFGYGVSQKTVSSCKAVTEERGRCGRPGPLELYTSNPTASRSFLPSLYPTSTN
ncbi:hypothetical protein GBA52_022894 [Prunus armeniaca]|nr:hypothetical protein GBA52_022894 [Prunus armeniaca]